MQFHEILLRICLQRFKLSSCLKFCMGLIQAICIICGLLNRFIMVKLVMGYFHIHVFVEAIFSMSDHINAFSFHCFGVRIQSSVLCLISHVGFPLVMLQSCLKSFVCMSDALVCSWQHEVSLVYSDVPFCTLHYDLFIIIYCYVNNEIKDYVHDDLKMCGLMKHFWFLLFVGCTFKEVTLRSDSTQGKYFCSLFLLCC